MSRHDDARAALARLEAEIEAATAALAQHQEDAANALQAVQAVETRLVAVLAAAARGGRRDSLQHADHRHDLVDAKSRLHRAQLAVSDLMQRVQAIGLEMAAWRNRLAEPDAPSPSWPSWAQAAR